MREDEKVVEQNSFATLDDEGQTTNSKTEDELGSNDSNVTKNNNEYDFDIHNLHLASYKWLVFLILSWIILFIIELFLTGLSTKGLDYWPVAMGNVSNIGILQPLDHALTHFIQIHYILGLLVQLLLFFVNIFLIILASLAAGFFHASIVHLCSNLFLFIMLSLALIQLKFKPNKIVKEWFFDSFIGIIGVWIVFEAIGIISQLMASSHTWMYQIVHSNVPILGASVGIYGLLGFLIVVYFKRVLMNPWYSLLLILILVVSFALLYQRFVDVKQVQLNTSLGVAILMSMWMHMVGFSIGFIHGFKTRLK